MRLQLNSVTNRPASAQFLAERLSLLEATNDGLDVYAHFAGEFQCVGYPRLDHNYPSPFPLDKRYRKSFRLSRGESGDIVFNDFAAQEMGNCFDFVMRLRGCDFRAARDYVKERIVPNWQMPYDIGNLVERAGRPRLVEKPLLTLQPWMRATIGSDNPTDYQRYDLVGITDEIRSRYHCYYLGGVHVGNRFDDMGEPAQDYVIQHEPRNPLYGYWYPSTDKWKLNRPLHPNKDYRWGPNNVRGADQPMFGQHLLPNPKEGKHPLGIIGAGQRDTMAVHGLTGVWTGCLSSESAHLKPDQFGLLSACFERLAFFSDDDEAGHRAAAHLSNDWGLCSLNPILHQLGENDVCAWLGQPTGQRADLRAQVGRDLLAWASRT